MSTSLRAGVGALFATVFAAASLVLAGQAIATTTPVTPAAPATITFAPVGPSMTQSYIRIGSILPQACDSSITTGEISITKDSAPAIGVVVDPGATNVGFLMTVPGTLANAPGGLNAIDVSVTCNVSSTPVTFTGTFAWAQINVTKIVEGPAPAGAAYPIMIGCTPVVTDASIGTSSVDPAAAPLEFPVVLASGETASVLAVTNATCTIVETDIMGATTSVVSSSSVTIAASTTYDVTVTNTYAETPKFTG